MSLTRLEVQNVRLLTDVVLEPEKGLNIIIGRNASGKTSLLEAIYLLGTGRSFRTKQINQVIRRGAGDLVVMGQISDELGERRVGLQHSGRCRTIHMNGSPVTSAAVLAQTLPLQAITPDTHYEFLRSSAYRRGVLDWWLFHVEPDFYPKWLRYRRLVSQRNAALRSRLPPTARYAWDNELASTGEQLDQWRREFVASWNLEFGRIANYLLGTASARFVFDRGWRDNTPLLEQLRQDRGQDEARGFTQSGPQRADIVLTFDDGEARSGASHGQQKMLIIALRLAQVRLFSQQTGRQCTLLADDVGAELDHEHRGRVLEMLAGLGSQVFATAIDVHEVLAVEHRASMFHVEHGKFHIKPSGARVNKSPLAETKMLE